MNFHGHKLTAPHNNRLALANCFVSVGTRDISAIACSFPLECAPETRAIGFEVGRNGEFSVFVVVVVADEMVFPLIGEGIYSFSRVPNQWHIVLHNSLRQLIECLSLQTETDPFPTKCARILPSYAHLLAPFAEFPWAFIRLVLLTGL